MTIFNGSVAKDCIDGTLVCAVTATVFGWLPAITTVLTIAVLVLRLLNEVGILRRWLRGEKKRE